MKVWTISRTIPYKEGVTIDTGKTTDEIMTSLVDNEKLKPGADQSGSDEYTACDLMTAVGKVGEETLTLNSSIGSHY